VLSTNNHNEDIVDIEVYAHSNVPNDSRGNDSNGLSGGLLLLVVSDDVVVRVARRCALLATVLRRRCSLTTLRRRCSVVLLRDEKFVAAQKQRGCKSSMRIKRLFSCCCCD
jgi:hypothetical protein